MMEKHGKMEIELRKEEKGMELRKAVDNYEEEEGGGVEGRVEGLREKTKQEFNHNMKRLKELDPIAANWLDKYDPRLWDKPIITMCEIIGRMLMKRIVAKREGIVKSQNVICHRIIDKLQRVKNDSKNYICHTTGDGRFELQSPWKRDVVDLKMMTCTCMDWDLTGIPCGHVVTAIYQIRGHPKTMFMHIIVNIHS
ncbi:hypothetical protein K1719_042556 [Acacia pycnantha]|nr:hypothetical protein K1719_042556 [Acacia pycnantha]